jgi:hypothetical protein
MNKPEQVTSEVSSTIDIYIYIYIYTHGVSQFTLEHHHTALCAHRTAILNTVSGE